MPRTRPVAPLTLPAALQATVPRSTREKILHAAVAVLNEEGFAALTQQRVCDAAGLRQSHLTYYFPTRNDLLRESALYGCEAMLDAVSRGIAEGSVNVGNMRVALNADITDRRWARLLNALIAASDEDAGIKPWLADFHAKARARLLQDFGRLGLRADAAEVELLYAAYIGAVQLDLGESTAASLARAQRVIGMALDRIAAGTPFARARVRKASSTPPARTRAGKASSTPHARAPAAKPSGRTK